jgi:nitrogen regulatory protein PII
MVVNGKGTAQSELIDLLGLNIHKAVIVSVVREDLVDEITKTLEQKFETIKNGKGIAFAVPMSGIIGVNMYQFLSNNRLKRGNE